MFRFTIRQAMLVNSSAPLRKASANDKRIASALSGTPEVVLDKRTAIIYNPSSNPMSSFKNKTTATWKIKFVDNERWGNQLMGWTSTRDPLVQTKLTFASAREAAEFAESQGFTYSIQESNHESNPDPQVKSYSDNFAYKGKLNKEEADY